MNCTFPKLQFLPSDTVVRNQKFRPFYPLKALTLTDGSGPRPIWMTVILKPGLQRSTDIGYTKDTLRSSADNLLRLLNATSSCKH